MKKFFMVENLSKKAINKRQTENKQKPASQIIYKMLTFLIYQRGLSNQQRLTTQKGKNGTVHSRQDNSQEENTNVLELMKNQSPS